MKRLFNTLCLLALAVSLSSCSGVKTAVASAVPVKTLNLSLTATSQANRFVGLDYGIKINVRDARPSETLLAQYDGSMLKKPTFRTNTDVQSFVSESVRRYMRTMGFQLNVDVSSDYIMNINIKEFNVSYLSGIGWSGMVELGVEVYDHNRQLVYPGVSATGRSNVEGTASDDVGASAALNKAYANALADVDWDRIAYFLKKADTPSLEKNKKVEGQGNTSLESTVIRWFIDSAPKGGDVSMRVVSSTPDVKNTNQNYVGSTPYETTEAFDIRGLTYNNSGDVQIEITCEKTGYITQKKRFNLRQAIDQKEISTKFNLVKEE